MAWSAGQPAADPAATVDWYIMGGVKPLPLLTRMTTVTRFSHVGVAHPIIPALLNWQTGTADPLMTSSTDTRQSSGNLPGAPRAPVGLQGADPGSAQHLSAALLYRASAAQIDPATAFAGRPQALHLGASDLLVFLARLTTGYDSRWQRSSLWPARGGPGINRRDPFTGECGCAAAVLCNRAPGGHRLSAGGEERDPGLPFELLPEGTSLFCADKHRSASATGGTGMNGGSPTRRGRAASSPPRYRCRTGVQAHQARAPGGSAVALSTGRLTTAPRSHRHSIRSERYASVTGLLVSALRSLSVPTTGGPRLRNGLDATRHPSSARGS